MTGKPTQPDWVARELEELKEENNVAEKEPASFFDDEEEKKPEPEEPSEEIDNGLEDTKPSVKEEKPKASKPKPKAEKKPQSKEEKPKASKPKADPEDKEKKPVAVNRNALRVVAIIAIIILIILIKRAPSAGDGISSRFEPVCSADEECIESGKVGFCLHPGTKEALCEYQEPKEVKLTVINDLTCDFCETSRMLNILKQLFPGIKKRTISADSSEGRAFINELSIKVLPAYVFDSSIEEALKFDKFRRALVNNGEYYLVTATASGSNYLFSRPSKPATIDLFVKSGQDTTVIDNSMKDVIDLFGSRITFNKQVVESAEEKSLEDQLAVTTYPAYIINNRLKYTGTQAAEIIKQRFCYLNSFPECETTLSLDIVTAAQEE